MYGQRGSELVREENLNSKNTISQYNEVEVQEVILSSSSHLDNGALKNSPKILRVKKSNNSTPNKILNLV